MMHFTFHCPTRIEFGPGVFGCLGEIVASEGIERALVVMDGELARRGVLDKAVGNLGSAGVYARRFGEGEPNPSVDVIRRGVESASDDGIDGVIGVGGGSGIDLAKMIAVLLTNPGDPTDYAGTPRLEADPLPVVAVPTTAGTGSEVTHVAVMSDPDRHLKFSMVSDRIIPRVAVLDPELTVSMPRAVTISSGLDALSHGIECYTNNRPSPLGQLLAGHAIELVGRNLEAAVDHPDDLKARSGMLLGSLIAGLGFKDKGLGLGHAMSYPLTGKFGIPHGVGNGMLLPVVMRYNSEQSPAELAGVGRILGAPADEDEETCARFAIERIERLLERFGVETNLRSWGVSEEALDELVEDVFHERRRTLLDTNPREPKRDEVKELFRGMLRR